MQVNNPLSFAILTIVLILALNGCTYSPVQGPIGIPLTEDDIENFNKIEGKSCEFYLFGIIPSGSGPRIAEAIQDARMKLSDHEKLEFTPMAIEVKTGFAVIGFYRCVVVSGFAFSR